MGEADITSMSVADRLKLIRKELEITQAELGDAIGLDRGTISNMECGKLAVRPRYLKLMEAKLCINKTWLQRGVGDMFIPKREVAILLDSLKNARPDILKIMCNLAKELKDKEKSN